MEQRQIHRQVLNPIFESYHHYFTEGFHTVLWNILIKNVYADKIITLHVTEAEAEDDNNLPEGAEWELVIVTKDEAGYYRTGVYFAKVAAYTDHCALLEEIVQPLFGQTPDESNEIITSSMNAHNKEVQEKLGMSVLSAVVDGDLGKAREIVEAAGGDIVGPMYRPLPLTENESFWPKDLPFKHTPGPWAITVFDNRHLHEPSVMCIETRGVCHTTEYIVARITYDVDKERQAEADGFLIRKAPEMLDLLLKSREEMLLMAKAAGCDLPVWRKRCIEPIDELIKSLL